MLARVPSTKSTTDTCPRCGTQEWAKAARGRHRCLKCLRTHLRATYIPERAREKRLARLKDPSKAAASRSYQRAYHRQLKTFWSQQLFEQAWHAQDGKCPICGVQMTLQSHRKHSATADHDHRTQKPRALLCSGCNSGLGFFSENALLLRAAADYVDKWEKR